MFQSEAADYRKWNWIGPKAGVQMIALWISNKYADFAFIYSDNYILGHIYAYIDHW